VKHTTYLATLALALVIVARVLVQLALYAAGFQALTADDFGRVVIADIWLRSPHAIWQGPWLPFHTYVIGIALYIWHDLLVVPRIIAFAFGSASLFFIYKLTYALFANSRIALISVVLLAVNPAHIWLSSVPLTEIMQAAFILGFLWANVEYILGKPIYYFYLSVALLSLDNTVRFEGWIFSVLFMIQMFFLLWRKHIRLHNLTIALVLLWIFPFAWITGNYLKTGDPLFFMTVNRAFDTKWYGSYSSYANYLSAFFEIDPYTTLLSIPAIILCLIYVKQNRAVYWITLYIVGALIAFAWLQRGQIQPHGNYIRYLALFLFIIYPLSAWFISWLLGQVLTNKLAWMAAITFILSLMGTWQVRSAFRFVNDPAAEGLRVGQHIRALRLQNPESASKPILIELHYWQYLAIHVGANDLSSLVYDRALNFNKLNDSSSRIQASPDLLPTCIQFYHISYIVVHSAELRQLVQNYLKAGPAGEYDGYAIYPVDEAVGHDQADLNQTCPLKIGTGY
jgi:hypothetical protein